MPLKPVNKDELNSLGKTKEGRPYIANPDGTYSTERTITIEDTRINNGKPTNIPTIYGGKSVSADEAIKIISDSKGIDPDTGRTLQGYDTIDEAVAAAKARSASIETPGKADQTPATSLKPLPQQQIEQELGAAQESPSNTSPNSKGMIVGGQEISPDTIKQSLANLARVPDAAVGVGEVLASGFTGLAGAFAGAVYGAHEALQSIESDKSTGESPGEAYARGFGQVSNAMTISPQTEYGKVYTDWFSKIFQGAGDMGHHVGTWVLDHTDSPLLATAADVAIAGLPYYVPLLIAKGKVNEYKTFKSTESSKAARLKEVVAERQQDLPLELSSTTEVVKTTPTDIIARAGLEDVGITRTPVEMVELSKKIKDAKAPPVITATRNKDGSIELLDKGDLDTLMLMKELGDKPVTLRVTEGTKGRSAEAQAAIDADYKKVTETYDRSEKQLKALDRQMRLSIIDKVKHATLDVSAAVKERLLETGGDVGKQAVMMHDLIAGATPKAQLRYQAWSDKIYANLSESEIGTLNQILQSRRIMEIDRIKGEGKTQHPGKTTATQHRNALIAMEERLGPDKFQELWQRSEFYDRATKQVLDDLYVEGLINKKAYNEMKTVMYEPRKFIHRIDPIPQSKLGGQKITVHDSGLKELSRGDIRALELDSRLLLAEYMIRAENRIAMNKANKALRNYAELYPENNWVRAAKDIKHDKRGKARNIHLQEGQVRIDVLIDGKQHPLIMDAAMAKQWITQSPQVSAMMANTMRVASGSFIVRPLATGYNPGFALANFPRDFIHAYITTSDFSPHFPIYMAQMSKNLAKTAKDAWKKEGTFKDYINENGGMNFLTHQGTQITVSKAGIKMSPRLRKVGQAMAKLNEFSEIWVRLAIRDRAIENGKSPVEATWEARNYLDFAQGGWATKGADHALPYLNASMQAFRTAARSAKQRPGEFVTKVAWLQATAGSLWLANYYANPELMNDISDAEMEKNWIIGTGMSFIDQNGNTRHVYFKIKKDNTMIPFTALTEHLLAKYMMDRTPGERTLKVLGESLPTVGAASIPTLAASMTYASNYDFWNDSKIWKGEEGLPPEQEYNLPPKQPTPPFFRDFGQWTGMSPERSEAAAKKLFPINPYTDLAGMGYKMMTEGLTPYDKSRTTMQILADTPILRRIIGITHPAAREMEKIEPMTQAGRGYRYDLARKLDETYFNLKQGEITGGERTVRAWINAQPPEERSRLTKRFEAQKAYDRIMSRYTGAEAVPSRLWWVNTGNEDSITRADLFYWEWRDADERGRRIMESMAGQMQSQGLGYRSDDFNKHLSFLKKFYGTDYGISSEEEEAMVEQRKRGQ